MDRWAWILGSVVVLCHLSAMLLGLLSWHANGRIIDLIRKQRPDYWAKHLKAGRFQSIVIGADRNGTGEWSRRRFFGAMWNAVPDELADCPGLQQRYERRRMLATAAMRVLAVEVVAGLILVVYVVLFSKDPCCL